MTFGTAHSSQQLSLEDDASVTDSSLTTNPMREAAALRVGRIGSSTCEGQVGDTAR
jgi:hypothetical protein